MSANSQSLPEEMHVPPLPPGNMCPETHNQAVANAEPSNWMWNDKSRTVWELAGQEWQDFKTKWNKAKANPVSILSLEDFPLPLPSTSTSPSPVLPSGPLLPSSLPLPLPSSLPLPLPSPHTSPSSSILVRKDYITMFDHVWARAFSLEGRTGVLITGQPGTGKTTFQLYLLVRLLRLKQVVLFSLDGVKLYLFYHDAVYETSMSALIGPEQLPQRAKSSRSNVFIWSLLDIEEEKAPPGFLMKLPCLPVQTASPNPVRYRSWRKHQMPLHTGFPLWTREELEQGLKLQATYNSLMDALSKFEESKEFPDIDNFPGVRALLEEREEQAKECGKENDAVSPSPIIYLLEAAIDRFGYSARDVFGAVFDYPNMTKSHQGAFNISYQKLIDDVRAILSGSVGAGSVGADTTTSNRIIALSPVYSITPFEDPDWMVAFKSKWVGINVTKKLVGAEQNEIRDQIRRFKRIPQASSMVGYLFEPLAHDIISKTLGGYWPLIRMDRNNNENAPQFKISPGAFVDDEIKLHKVERNFHSFDSIHDLPKPLENNAYYVPSNKNFPLFDSFTVDINDSERSAVLWVLQMTNSRFHRGSKKGYVHIHDIMSILKEQLSEKAPPEKATKKASKQIASRPTITICYLLVVPKGEKERWWKFPNGWNESIKTNDHRGSVYCLEVPFA